MEDLITLYNDLKGRHRDVGVGLSLQVTTGRTRRNDKMLFQGRFKLDIRKEFHSERVIKDWKSG